MVWQFSQASLPKAKRMQIPIDNSELLVGLLLVVTSVVGLVGGNVALGALTLNLGTAKGLAYAFILAVGVFGLAMITRELFGS
ncbi:hypothetical protein C7293_01040 [filamentous cyanobacterium CCT1]|nr:hypothetical protein C7293_01040 [filamentous cyanobacterium CCT1]PSN80294.1 hypothetical protein C8B47_07270 [filamentous cyanobacterium CCP4]